MTGGPNGPLRGANRIDAQEDRHEARDAGLVLLAAAALGSGKSAGPFRRCARPSTEPVEPPPSMKLSTPSRPLKMEFEWTETWSHAESTPSRRKSSAFAPDAKRTGVYAELLHPRTQGLCVQSQQQRRPKRPVDAA